MKDAKNTLVQRAQNGDVDAFAELFEELRPMVFSIAYRLVGPDEADDVVMETYLKAWQAIPRFNLRSSLKTWVYRVTRNCALDSVRARQRHRARVVGEVDTERDIAQIADERPVHPADRMATAETVDQVQAAMAKMAPEHRTALQLRFSDGLTYAEIAAATGVSIGTVMSRLFNGKRKLSRILREEAMS